MPITAAASTRPDRRVSVVGIGADGWDGLGSLARQRLADAAVIVASERQLALLPDSLGAERVSWPSPMMPALAGLLERHRSRGLVVLASGDPMFYGVGGTLARLIGPDALEVVPQLSSLALACARLGWPAEAVETISVVGRPKAALLAALSPGRRLLVLLESSDDSSELAALATGAGYGASELTLLGQLGGAAETLRRGIAAEWTAVPHEPLAVLALQPRLADARAVLPRTPGLPDEAFDSDGQLTKREVRAVTLSALRPAPGELLWDVGAGSGSVGIEWMRSHPDCRAIAIEPRPDRLERIAANAERLGVPGLQIVAGRAPDALAALAEFGVPDAVFVGGGVSVDGVLDACLAALPTGGRLVANGVTLETEVVLAQAFQRYGGELSRIAVQRAAPVGAFNGWRAAMPVTQWHYRKDSA
ncbi:MAG: precorrin-6Y methyltransferase [Frankiales bacterium]|nr:precorrin-6Y methyltransferase [Frankiales bacterium]